MTRANRNILLVALPIFLIALAGNFFCWSTLPQHEAFRPWLPEEARVLPSERVTPGTFKISLSEKEMIQKFSEKEKPDSLLAVYQGDGTTHSFQYAGMTYWLPAENGMFYWMTSLAPRPKGFINHLFYCWEIKFDEQRREFVYNAGRAWSSIGLYSFFMFLSGLFGIAAWRNTNWAGV